MGPSCSTRPIVPCVSSGITRTDSPVWWLAWRHGRAAGRPPHTEAVRPRILPAGPPRKAPTPEPRGPNAPAAHRVTVPELHECQLSNVDCRMSNDHDLRERIDNRTPPSDNRKRLCSCSRTLRTHLGEMSHQSRVSRLLCPARQARLAPPSVASSACDHHASPSVMTLFNYSALVRQSKPDPEEFQRGMGG